MHKGITLKQKIIEFSKAVFKVFDTISPEMAIFSTGNSEQMVIKCSYFSNILASFSTFYAEMPTHYIAYDSFFAVKKRIEPIRVFSIGI